MPDRIRNRFNNDMDRANIQRYSSYVTVIDDGREVRTQEVAVNSPLRYNGYRFYQSSYDPDNPRVIGQYDALRLALTDSAGRGLDTLTLEARRGNRRSRRHAARHRRRTAAAFQARPAGRLQRVGASSSIPPCASPSAARTVLKRRSGRF